MIRLSKMFTPFCSTVKFKYISSGRPYMDMIYKRILTQIWLTIHTSYSDINLTDYPSDSNMDLTDYPVIMTRIWLTTQVILTRICLQSTSRDFDMDLKPSSVFWHRLDWICQKVKEIQQCFNNCLSKIVNMLAISPFNIKVYEFTTKQIFLFGLSPEVFVLYTCSWTKMLIFLYGLLVISFLHKKLFLTSNW